MRIPQCYILALLSLALPTAARAQAPIYFWGLERSCEQQTPINRQAERQLHSAAQTFALLQTPSGKPLPPCQGEQCAQVLRRACPAASGRLLGGQVVQGRDTARFRLWLYDLGTGQIAFSDDYVQSQAIQEAFITQAKALIANPRFGTSPPSPKPTYCTASVPARSDSESKGPLFLSVYGDGKHRAALHASLEQQLQLLGRSPQPVTVDPRTFSVSVLQHVVSGQQNAQVLGAETKKDGTVELFLFDQKTNQMQESSIDCPNCKEDSTIAKVKQGVSDLLEHCFSDQCAQSGFQPPAEACEPFPEQQCAGLDELLSPGTRLPARHIDPVTAKVVKGSLWGLFSASAVTSIALFGANATSAGAYVDINGASVGNALWRPAWAAAGISIGLLGVAIPVTIMVNHATIASPSTASQQSNSASPIQCPG